MNLFLIASVLLAPIYSFSAEPLMVTQLDETWTKKSLSEETKVQFETFSIVVPKGWSAVIKTHKKVLKTAKEQTDSMITLTPTEALETSPIYIGVKTQTKITVKTSDAEFEKLSKEKDLSVKRVEWNDREWLLTEKDTLNTAKVLSKQWTATYQNKKRQWVVLAGAPVDQSDKYTGIIQKTLSSIELR